MTRRTDALVLGLKDGNQILLRNTIFRRGLGKLYLRIDGGWLKVADPAPTVLRQERPRRAMGDVT